MKLEGTPDEVLALLTSLADRVTRPTLDALGKGTPAARALERTERDEALARAETAEAELDRLRLTVDRWPDRHEIDLDATPPPLWIRAWCANNPLPTIPNVGARVEDLAFVGDDPGLPGFDEPAAPASPNAGGEQPLRDDNTPLPAPLLDIRLRTPEERAEWEAAHAITANAKPAKTPPGRGLARAIGEPGADVGDGLDVWRVDGRALYQRARSDALSRGATPAEASKVDTYSDADYAALAAAVDALRDAGDPKPVRTIAGRLGRSGPGALEQALTTAAKRGVIGGGHGPTKGGGVRPESHTLTDYGRQLLAEPPTAELEVEPDHVDPDLVELATITAPTPEQQAAIDRLNDEGKKIVDRLQRGKYSGPKAELPSNLIAVKNPSIPKALRRAATEARYAGWAIGRGAGGHLHWLAPDGRKIVTSSTPGGHPAADLRDLRAAGIKA